MKIITVSFQINMPCKSRVILFRCNLHLQGERQIILDIWIIQIGNIAICPCPAQSIKIHDLRSRFSIHFRYQMCVRIYTVSVKIDCNFNRRIRFQNRPYCTFCILICPAAVKLPINNIIHSAVMKRLNPIRI